MANETRHSRVCPNCGNKLSFSSEQSSVHCPCCDSDYSVSELLQSTSTSAVALNPTFAQENIDSNESGLAYLDSVFGILDWDDFCTNNPTLFVDSVRAVVDKMKVKFANQPMTWMFEFKSVAVPLQKRFAFMEKTLGEIGSSDMDLEDEELLSKFDCYSLSVDLLLKQKEFIKKCLNIDLEMMKKFKIDSFNLKICQIDYDEIINKLEKLKLSDSVYDLDIVKEKRKNKEDEILKMYKKEGIDAEETYEEALKAYLFGNKTDALRLFESISDYRDSFKYIIKLKQVYFTFDERFVEFAGVNYLYGNSTPDKEPEEEQQKSKKKLFSLSKPQPQQQSVTQTFIAAKKLFEFRPIVDGVKAEDPVLKKIFKIIMAYGDNLFYIDDTNSLMCYDFSHKIATKLMELKNCDISDKVLIKYPLLGKFVFLAPMEKKKKPAEKGCSMKKSAQPTPEDMPTIASFRLAIVNCDTRTVSFYGEDVLCITDHFEDKIFYTQGIFKKDKSLDKKVYYVYDVSNNRAISPFNREVYIYNVVDNYIIYGLWTPNAYNIDLYSYNMDTTEITLLEKNVYDIAKKKIYDEEEPLTVDGYIYYVVGNSKFNPLYRVKPDGSDKKEIMSNVENINFIRNGYFYITKAHPFFFNGKWHWERSLIKSKSDGTSRTFICGHFSYIITFKQGFIYYIDTGDDLHIVRADGEKDRIIAYDCEEVLLINEKNIFFTRKERVSKNKIGKSLYTMDLQGNNLHKLAFDVQEIETKWLDENNIYYSVKDKLAYKVRTPKNDKEYNPPVTNYYNVVMYYALNINDLHLTRIYVDGVPQFDKGHEAKGCKLFNKRVLPTLAEQIEYIYPMPEKTKLSFIDEENSQNQPVSVANIASNIKGAGCSPKKK